MASVLTEIIIDCSNPATLARWWADVLGWIVTDDERGFAWISRAGTYTDRPLLVFLPVPEPKVAKNRLHLDLSPSGLDQAEELERLEALGAVRVDVGQGEVPWVVLADPEGNEFCLLGRRIDP